MIPKLTPNATENAVNKFKSSLNMALKHTPVMKKAEKYVKNRYRRLFI